MNIWWKRLVILLVVVGIASLPIWMYFNYYQDAITWNDNAVQTNCTVTKVYPSKTQCPCNCKTIVRRACPICYQVCYSGLIDVSYNAFDKNYTNTFRIYANYLDEAALRQKMDLHYYVGQNIPCYYNKDNPGKSLLELVDASNLWNSIISFVVVDSFVVTGWICYELYCQRRKRRSSY